MLPFDCGLQIIGGVLICVRSGTTTMTATATTSASTNSTVTTFIVHPMFVLQVIFVPLCGDHFGGRRVVGEDDNKLKDLRNYTKCFYNYTDVVFNVARQGTT